MTTPQNYRKHAGEAPDAEPRRKVISIAEAATRARQAQAEGRTVVMCHGCFDIVHPGHLRHLTWAKQQGDVLIVSISADVTIEKGVGRPLVTESLRAENLAALECVDVVVVTPTATAVETLGTIKPDRYVKGAEYRELHDPRLSAERDVVRGYGGQVLFSSGDVVYSSTRLIRDLSGDWPLRRERVAGFAHRHGLGSGVASDLLRKAAGLRCLVIGDTILDEYLHCDPTHVAGESPMMNATLIDRERFMGGAAIVAQHLRGLGAQVTLGTPIGPGKDADALRRMCDEQRVRLIPLRSRSRMPRKRRFLAKGVKVFKLDDAPAPAYGARAVGEFLRDVVSAGSAWDLAILLDFGYGTLTQDSLPPLLRALRQRSRVLLGDVSGPRADLLALRECDLLLPTESELRSAYHAPTESLSALAGRLASQTGARAVVAKLGEDGLVAFDNARGEGSRGERMPSDFLPAFTDRAVDPLGCGDALLSAAGLALAAGGDVFSAAFVGATAAAMEAETRGNRPVLLEPLLQRIDAEVETLGLVGRGPIEASPWRAAGAVA